MKGTRSYAKLDMSAALAGAAGCVSLLFGLSFEQPGLHHLNPLEYRQ